MDSNPYQAPSDATGADYDLLAIAWSIAAIASFILAPLGVFLLMRLWRKDVWISFARTAAR